MSSGDALNFRTLSHSMLSLSIYNIESHSLSIECCFSKSVNMAKCVNNMHTFNIYSLFFFFSLADNIECITCQEYSSIINFISYARFFLHPSMECIGRMRHCCARHISPKGKNSTAQITCA